MDTDDKAFWEIKGFNEQARMSCVNRNELRAVLLEQIEEEL